MKRGQVSFEYSILFAFVFLLFLILATAFFYNIRKVDSSEYIAENLAEEIKIKLITASLSETDYKTIVEIPKNIDSEEIEIEIHTSPDNIIFIKEKDSGITLARTFLPELDDTTLPNPANDFEMIITRTDNKLEISN